MADKTIGELTAATAVTQGDRFVMEQNGEAKSVTGQVLKRDLAKMLDGHGGIQNIALVKSEGFVDTYEITTADGTKFQYSVTNGKDGIDGKDGERGPVGPSGTPKNWLDNSYFPHSVNQRGKDRYTNADVDCVDRWVLRGSSSELYLLNGRAYIKGLITQDISEEAKDYLYGKTVTISLRDGYGGIYIASGDFNEGFAAYLGGVKIGLTNRYVSIESQAEELYFPEVALYEGIYTEEDVPAYKYKGYAAELLECQRYYRRFLSGGILAMGYTTAAGKVFFTIPTNTDFVSQPTPTALSDIIVRYDGGFTHIPGDVIPQIEHYDSNSVTFTLGDEFMIPDHQNAIVAIYSDSDFELSAE
mgnify:CR=1 FL=1